jgi:lysophospholipase L1-like esterase
MWGWSSGPGGGLGADLSNVGVTTMNIQATTGSGLFAGGQGAGAPRHWMTEIPALAAGDKPDLLVIALGTNDYGAGPIYGRKVQSLLRSIPSTQRIMWLLPAQVPRLMPEIGTISSQIADVSKTFPNVRVADSNILIGANPGFIGPDGVHYTAAGFRAFAQFIAASIKG